MIRPSPMVLRSFVVALALASLTACPRKTEGGLVLKVTIEPGVRADCIVVDATSNGVRASRSTITRQAMKNDYFIGISRGEFPASLEWQASAYQGRCADELEWKLSSRSPSTSQLFPPTGVEQFELVIGQPDATLDADRDTWVDTGKGGTDCNDTDAQVNPGARQVCSSTIDTNCNGKLFCDDSTCSNEAACTTAATGLAYTTTLATLVASDCSGAVTVQSVANGRPAAVASDVTVTLMPTGTPSAGLELFSDSACTTRLTTSTLPLRFGTNQVTFSFRARTPGALTLTASAPGLGSSTLATTITDRPVVSLSVNPVSVSARAGACSTAIEVTALDDRMMPTNVGATPLALAIGYLPAGTNTVDVYTDPTCMTLGLPSIPTGGSSTLLYLKGTRVTPTGMPIQVQVSSPGLGAPASLDFVVTAGDPHKLEFTTQVFGTRNNECNSAPVELLLYDQNSNLTTAGTSGLNIGLATMPPSGGGSLEFFTSPTCMGTATTTLQMAAGQSSVRAYVRAIGPGTYSVTATTSLPVPTASLQVDVSTMDPTALFFPSAGVTLATTAGTCSPAVRLQTREMNSSMSPVSPVRVATTVTIAPSAAVGVSFFSDANCMVALTNNQLVIGAGTSEVSFYFRANRSSSVTLSASATNFITTSPTQPIRIAPAPTSKLVFDAPAVVSAIAGQCSGGLVLRSFDSFDNPTSASGPVTPAAAPVVTAPEGVVFSSAPSCTPTATTVSMNDGGVTFYVSAQRAQRYTITATGFSVQSTDAGVFTVDAGSPSVLAVVSQPMATVSASECTPVTLERRDGFGNPSPGAAQPFTVAVNTTGILSVHNDLTSCTAGMAAASLSFAAGQTRATFYARGRLVGTSTLTATSGAAMAATNAISVIASTTTTLRFATGSPSASSSVGGCLQATVERLDTEGNLTGLPGGLSVTSSASGVGSTNLVLSSSSSACGTTAQSSVSLTFTGSATSTTFSYSPRATGMLTFTVSGNGLTSAVGTTNVTAGSVDRVAFVSPPTGDQQYDGCVPLDIEALDVGGNRVADTVTLSTSVASVGTFFANATCMGAAMNMVSVPASGVGSFWFKPLPMTLGMVTVQATPSVGVSGRASLPLNIIAGVETKLTRNDFPATNTAGDCVDFTVTRLDSGDHPTQGAQRAVSVSATGAAATAPNEALLYAGLNCQGTGVSGALSVDIMAGASSTTFSVRLRKVGAITIATASNPLSAPANTTTTVGVGALATLTFTTTPPASLAINTCSPAITVTGQDSQGNAAPLGTQTLAMMNGSFFSDSGCTMSLASLTGGASSETFYLQNSSAGTKALTVGSTVSVMQNWNITPPPVTTLQFKAPAPTMMTRLTCSGPYRLQSTDGTNIVNSGVARTITLAGSGVQYFSDNTCSTAITTTTLGATESETADVYAVAFGTASTTLTADAAPALTQATAPVTIMGMGALSLVATQASSHLEYRSCIEMTVARQVAPSTAVTGFATVLNLTKSGTAGASSTTFHLTNDCSDAAVTTATIPTGASSVPIYVLGHSAEPTGASTAASATLTATDAFASGFGADNEVFTVYPAVRRGSCSIGSGQSSSNTGSSTACSLGLELAPTAGVRNRSFFTFSVSMGTGLGGATDQNVSCALNSTPTVIDCERVGNPSSVINIEWQLLSFGRGVSVQHLSQVITATPRTADIPLAGETSRAGTFFLASYRNNSGGLDWDDFPAMELVGPTGMPYQTLQLRNGGFDYQTPFTLHAQVVTWQGLAVESGIVSNSTGGSWTGSPLTANSATAALLFTNRISAQPGSNGGSICRYRLRGSLNAGTPSFNRGSGAGGQCTDTSMGETVWYRLGFPASVGAVFTPPNPLTFTNGGSPTATWNLNRLVPHHRTWSFHAGQGPGGQSGGETNRAGDNDDLGCAVSRITMADGANTIVTLTRGTTTAAAGFSPFLVVLAE